MGFVFFVWFRLEVAFKFFLPIFELSSSAQGPSRTCNESKEEEEEAFGGDAEGRSRLLLKLTEVPLLL